MLERKQKTLRVDISRTEKCLAEVALHIAEIQQECSLLNQKIKNLTPAGLLSRSDIYTGIRRQGSLLTCQQQLLQEIIQLESEQHQLEQNLQQQKSEINMLNKKHYKFSCYLSPLHRKYLRCCENNAENEIQEIAGYGREKF